MQIAAKNQPVPTAIPSTTTPVLEMDNNAYQHWRESKLERYLVNPEQCLIEIGNPAALTKGERGKIGEVVSKNNFFIYQYRTDQTETADGYRAICRQLGLFHSIPNPGADEHHVTLIQASNRESSSAKQRYIPYSSEPLNWHTDGYYNDEDRRVRSFVLHCKQDAPEGGANGLIDHEIAYILLRDQNPQWAQALCHPRCFTIPANSENGHTIRPDFSGAVFSTDPLTGMLYTRYTERKRHIYWREDEDTLDAIAWLKSVLDKNNNWTIRVKLEPGQGMICNNILHNRSKFRDSETNMNPRCLHRIRYRDRINVTGQ